MNRPPNKSRKKRRTIRPWTYARVQAALPYLRSVVQSVREHRLQAQVDHLRVTRLANHPGRPDRDRLIAQEEALRAAEKEQEAFEEALRELSRLDVYVLDPLAGQACLPFIHNDQLAWFLFDLFVEGMLDSWRYHEDPLEVRRPLSEIDNPPPAVSFTV